MYMLFKYNYVHQHYYQSIMACMHTNTQVHYHARLRSIRFTTDGTTQWSIDHSIGDEEIKYAYMSEADGPDRRDFRKLFPRLREFFDAWERYEEYSGTIPEAMR